MDIIEFMKNNGNKEVSNPNYKKNSKKNTEPPKIKVPDLTPDTDNTILDLALTDYRNQQSVDAKIAKRYNDRGINYSVTAKNLDKELADSQSLWVKAGNSLSQILVSELALGIPKGFADIMDFVTSKILHVTEDDYQNPISDTLGKWQDTFKEDIAPIYTDPNINIQNGGLTDASWYFKNLPTVASTLTLLYPARTVTGGLGMLNKFAKVKTGFGAGSLVSKTRRWATQIDKVKNSKDLGRISSILNNPENITKANEAAKLVSDGLLMRVAENYQEAREAHISTYQMALDKLSAMDEDEYDDWVYTNKNIFDDKNLDIKDKDAVAKHIAKKAADRTFSMDFSNAIFDIIQLHGLKNIGKGVKAIKKGTNKVADQAHKASIQAAKDFARGTEAAAESALKVPMYKKVLNAAKDFAKYNTKTLLEESTEGIEEAVNYIAQEEGITYGKMLLEGEEDDYKANVFSGIYKSWANMQGDLFKYMKSPELQESAFWGVMGGMVFSVGGNFTNKVQREMHMKAEKEARKNSGLFESEKAKNYESWFNIFEGDDARRARNGIENRQTRLSQLAEDIRQIRNNKNILGRKKENGEYEEFKGDDTSLQQELAIREVKDRYIAGIALDAMDTGTFDFLTDYFRSEEVKDAMVKAGVATREEIERNTMETLRQLNQIRDEYQRQSTHVLNNIAILNGSKEYNHTIPLEYANSIARDNLNTKLKIQSIDRQIAATELTADERAKIGVDFEKSENFEDVKAVIRLGALDDIYGRLVAEKKQFEERLKLDKNDYMARLLLNSNERQRKVILDEIRKTTFKGEDIGLYALFFANKHGGSYIRNEKGEYGIDIDYYKREDEKILEDVKSVFDGTIPSDVESISQRAKALHNEVLSLISATNPNSLFNTNKALFGSLLTLTQLHNQRQMTATRLVESIDDTKAEVDYLMNTMDKVRGRAIKKAYDVLVKSLRHFGVETDEDGNGIKDVILDLYNEDKGAARAKIQEMLSKKPSSEFTTQEIIDALDIFSLKSDNSKDAFYKEINDLIASYENEIKKANEPELVEEEEEEEESGVPANGPTPSGTPAPSGSNTARPSRKVAIGLNRNGTLKNILANSKSKHIVYENTDGSYELDIMSSPKNEQLNLASSGLFDIDSDIDILNDEWEIVSNPTLTKQGRNFQIQNKGRIAKKSNALDAAYQTLSQELDNNADLKNKVTTDPLNAIDDVKALLNINDQDAKSLIDKYNNENKPEPNDDEVVIADKVNDKDWIDKLDTTDAAKQVVRNIVANQERVDKENTTGEHYRILEDDGNYYYYDRMHQHMGHLYVQNFEIEAKVAEARQKIEAAKTLKQYNNVIALLEYEHNVDLSRVKNDFTNRGMQIACNLIKGKLQNFPVQRSFDAGSAVDVLIRDFFNGVPANRLQKPAILTDKAFTEIKNILSQIAKKMKDNNETFLTNNIVLFHKYKDGTRIAGEVDILSVDKDGNFYIYDVKTGKQSFTPKKLADGSIEDRFAETRTKPDGTVENILDTSFMNMSKKEYYSLQLSGYHNLLLSEYGVAPKGLAIVPFLLKYDRDQVSQIEKEDDVPIQYNDKVDVRPEIGNPSPVYSASSSTGGRTETQSSQQRTQEEKIAHEVEVLEDNIRSAFGNHQIDPADYVKDPSRNANAEIEDIANKVRQEVKDALKTSRFTAEDIDKVVDEIANEYKQSVIELRELFGDDDLSLYGADLAFNAKFAELGSTNFAPVFHKTVDAFLEEYKKIRFVPTRDGKQLVKLEDVLRICNNIFSTTDNTVAKSLYNLVREYLLSDVGRSKYIVEDEQEGENVLNHIVKSDNENEKVLGDSSLHRVNIADFIDEAHKNNDAKYLAIFDNLKVGDTVEASVSGNKVLISAGGVTLGTMTIPGIVGSEYSMITKGWNTRLSLNKNGKVVSTVKQVIENLFFTDSASHQALRTIIHHAAALDRNSKTYNADFANYVNQFAANPLIANLIQNSINAWNNGQYNILFVKNNQVDPTEILDFLTNIWRFSTGRLYGNTRQSRRAEAKQNLNDFFDKLYAEYDFLYKLTPDSKFYMVVGSINEGEINKVVEDNTDLHYDELPLIQSAVATDTEFSLSFTNSLNQAINSDGRVTEAKKFGAHSTLITVFSKNTEPDYVKAYGVKLNDANIKDTEANKYLNAVRNHIRSVFRNISETNFAYRNDYLIDSLKSIIRSANNNDRISLFGAANGGKYYIDQFAQNSKHGTYTGIRVRYINKNGITKEFSFITKTPYSDVAYNAGNKYIFRTSKNENTFFSNIALDFCKFLQETGAVDISEKGISSDNKNLANSIKFGFIQYDNSKVKVKIPDADGNLLIDEEYDSYNDFIVKNNLIRVNTRVGSNGTNFNRLANNQITNQNLLVSLPATADTSSTTNAPTLSNDDIVDDDTDTRSYTETKDIINNEKQDVGKTLFKKVLGDEAYDKFSEVANEFNILDDILPSELSYDSRINSKDKKGNWLGGFAIARSQEGHVTYRGYVNGKGNTVTLAANTKIAIGPLLLNYLSSSNLNKRKEGIRKLIHENLHRKFAENRLQALYLIKSVKEVHRETLKAIEDDLKTYPENSDEYKRAKYVKQVITHYLKTNAKNKEEITLEEFIVESLTNSTIYNYLNSKSADNATDNKKEDTLFTKILKAIAKFFGWNEVKDGTLMMKQLNALRESLTLQSPANLSNITNTNNNEINQADTTDSSETETLVAEEETKPEETGIITSEEGIDLNYDTINEDDDYDDDDGIRNAAFAEQNVEPGWSKVGSVEAFKETLPLEVQSNFDSLLMSGEIEMKCR